MNRFDNKQTTLLSRTELRTVKGQILYWCLFAILVIVAGVTLFPCIWMVLNAFKTPREIAAGNTFIPENFSLKSAIEQILYAWDMLEMERSIVNTLFLSLTKCAITVLCSGFAGYVLSKRRQKGMGVVFTLVVWTMMMPGSVRTVSTYLSYLSFPFIIDDGFDSVTNVNVLNTYIPFWVSAAAGSFTLILFKNAFDAIPNTLVDAARIDGCSNVRIFFQLMLPLAKPTVFYVMMGALSGPWSDYFTPYLLLSDKSKYTVPAWLFVIESKTGVTQNVYMMGLIFASIPPAILYLFFQRRMSGGIMRGAVKG